VARVALVLGLFCCIITGDKAEVKCLVRMGRVEAASTEAVAQPSCRTTDHMAHALSKLSGP